MTYSFRAKIQPALHFAIAIAVSLASSATAGPIKLLKDLKPGFLQNDAREIVQIASTSDTLVVVSNRRTDNYSNSRFELNLISDTLSNTGYGFPLASSYSLQYSSGYDKANYPFYVINDNRIILPYAPFPIGIRFVEVEKTTGNLIPLTKPIDDMEPLATWNCPDGKIGFLSQSFSDKSWKVCQFDADTYDSIDVTTSIAYRLPAAAFPPSIGQAFVIDGFLFFSVGEGDGDRVSLYRTDGTAAGTTMICSEPVTYIGLLKGLGKCLFTVGDHAVPSLNLYSVDTVSDKPYLITDDFGGTVRSGFNYASTESSSTVYWVSYPYENVFASDGDTVRELPSLPDSDVFPIGVHWVADQLFITAQVWGYEFYRLYETDGFATPTLVQSGQSPFENIFATLETTSGIYVQTNHGVYLGSGDLNNSVLIAQDSHNLSDNPILYQHENRTLYLRKTDSGSLQSDQVFANNSSDIYAPEQITRFTETPDSSNPSDLLTVSNRLFFRDMSRISEGYYTQSYRTDGTAESTIEINADNSSWLGASLNGAVYYIDTRLWNDDTYFNDGSVYVSSGNSSSESPTNLTYSFGMYAPQKLFADYGNVYFSQSNGYDPVLYKTDGTQSGTSQVYIDNSNTLEDTLWPIGLTNNLPVVYGRTTNTSTIGYEIWTARMQEYQSIKLGESSTPPTKGALLPDGRLIFGATMPGAGEEVMITDGTVTGTTVFADLIAGPESSQPREFVRAEGRVFFVAKSDAVSEKLTIWTTDGSTIGNAAIASNLALFDQNCDVELTASEHGGVYAKVIDGQTVSLVFTTGLPEGTRSVYSGLEDSNPKLLAEVNGFMYLALTTSELGRELYRTKGHEGGIDLVEDFAPGRASGATMEEIAILGNRIIFSANSHDGLTGRELHYLDVVDSNVRDWALY